MKNIYHKEAILGEKHIRIPLDVIQKNKNHPLLHGTYITEIGSYPNAYHHYVERSSGSCEYIYIYCFDGIGLVEVDNISYRLLKDEVLCIPKNKKHLYYADTEKPWSILWFHFQCDDYEIYNEDNLIHIHELSEHQILQIQKYFRELFALSTQVGTLSNMITLSNIISNTLTITFLADSKPQIDINNDIILKCITYMKSHIDETITLKTLRDLTNVSASYLSSIFLKYMNHSPIDYFIYLRIMLACQYLRLSNLRINEISSKVGYKDPLYFSRIFRKHMGISPRDYRQQIPHQ